MPQPLSLPGHDRPFHVAASHADYVDTLRHADDSRRKADISKIKLATLKSLHDGRTGAHEPPLYLRLELGISISLCHEQDRRMIKSG